MRTITVIALSFLVLYASAATSSSSATTSASSSSKAASASSSSGNSTGNSSTNSSSSSSGALGECSKGDDAPCLAISTEFCCLYSYYQYTGEEKHETYSCTINPSKLGVLSSLVGDASSAISSLTASSGYSSGQYCANSVFVRVSAVLASIGFVSLLF